MYKIGTVTMKTNLNRIHMNSTSSAIVFDKPGLAAPRGKQERDGGVVVNFSDRSTPVGVKLSECGIVSNSATLLYPFSSKMASAVLSFCPAVLEESSA